MIETQRRLRGHDFLPADVSMIPALYGTEDVKAADKMLHLHYFVGGCDWWVAEYDPDSHLAFGYACLNDPENAEWGYVDLSELEKVRASVFSVVERDLDWTPIKASDAELPGRG